MAEQTPENLWGLQVSLPSEVNPVRERLKGEVLAHIAKRYFPLGMSDPDPELLRAMAKNALRSQFAKRFPDEELGDYLGEDGSWAARPTIAWDNPVAREIARAEYRDGGMDALIALDPGYEAYRGYEPGPDNGGYDAHLLPPGYADYLRAERDYDLLGMIQDPNADLDSRQLLVAMQGDVPFSRYANLGTEYYPRFYDQGMGNAFGSGTDAPVAAGLTAMNTVPNTIYYAADDGLRPSEAGVPGLGIAANPVPLIARSAEKAIRELGRSLHNKVMGRELPIADRQVGSSGLEKTADVLEESDRRSRSVPPQNTDFVRNVTGLNAPPVVGDAADFVVNYLDGTPFLGGLSDLSSTARAASNAGESVGRAVGAQLRNDALIDTSINAGISAALPPQERTWGEYLFKPETQRMAPPPEEVSKAATAEEPKFSYGTPVEARGLINGGWFGGGLGRDERKELYRADPATVRKLIDEKSKRDVRAWGASPPDPIF